MLEGLVNDINFKLNNKESIYTYQSISVSIQQNFVNHHNFLNFCTPWLKSLQSVKFYCNYSTAEICYLNQQFRWHSITTLTRRGG